MSGKIVIVDGEEGSTLVVPGEMRTVDREAARKLGYLAQRAAGELGFDKVTAGVALLDLAVGLLRTNSPPVPEERVREAFERALAARRGT